MFIFARFWQLKCLRATKIGKRALLFHNQSIEMCKMQQILINLKSSQKSADLLLKYSRANAMSL